MIDVFIKLKSNNKPVDDINNQDIIEVITTGKYERRGNNHFLKYDEIEGSKENISKTNLEFREAIEGEFSKLSITKSGWVNTVMTVEEGQTLDSWYETPYGGIKISIWGQHINFEINKNEGKIECVYQIAINSIATSINHLEISFSNIEPKEGEN